MNGSVTSDHASPLVSAVIVNFNAWPDVAALVASLSSSAAVTDGRCEIVVVDNASDGPLPESLATPPPGVKLIQRADNGGFAVGVNAGWRAARGRWILLLNPDVVADAGLLARIVDRASDYEAGPSTAPGIVGFGLRNPDGTRQPSVGTFPTLGRTVWEQLIPRSRRKYQAGWRLKPGPVAWVTGACVLLSAALLDELGGLDEDFFLYYEEVALCRSAVRRGWRVEYDPTVEVVHLRPLQNRPVTPKLRVITRHSKLLYFSKHLPRWQFLGLCGVVAAEGGRWRRWRGRGNAPRKPTPGERSPGSKRPSARGSRWPVATCSPWPRPRPPNRRPRPRGPPATRTVALDSRVEVFKDEPAMSHLSRIARIGFLTVAAAAYFYWTSHHAEVSFADGLRYIREAQTIKRGDYAGGLLNAVDHPVHPILIALAHRWIDPDPGPYAWQTAAQAVATLALVLAVVPLYLLGRDLFEDETTALLACIFVLSNPVISYIEVNVLSESTFLLFWLFGLWASVRFLREGKFGWLPPAIGFGGLAYLTRPEGMLLHVALVATLLLLPLHRVTRINWPRWCAAVALLVLGPALLIGPYVLWKGGLGTKPAVARMLGTMPEAPPAALERERLLPPDQTITQTYMIACMRAVRAFAAR